MQDCKGTFNGVIVSTNVSALVMCILEELDIVCQLLFLLLALFWADLTSHVGHNDKVLQHAVTAELPEHSEVLHCYAFNSEVRDVMHVNDTHRCLSFPVTIKR